MQDARKQKRSAQMKIIDAKRVGVRTRTQDQKNKSAARRKQLSLLSIPFLMSKNNVDLSNKKTEAERCKAWRQRPTIAARIRARQREAAAQRRQADPLEGYQRDEKIDRAVELLWTNTGQEERPLIEKLRECVAEGECHRDKKLSGEGNPKEDNESYTPGVINLIGGGNPKEDNEIYTPEMFNPTGGGNPIQQENDLSSMIINPNDGVNACLWESDVDSNCMYQSQSASNSISDDLLSMLDDSSPKPVYCECRNCQRQMGLNRLAAANDSEYTRKILNGFDRFPWPIDAEECDVHIANYFQAIALLSYDNKKRWLQEHMWMTEVILNDYSNGHDFGTGVYKYDYSFADSTSEDSDDLGFENYTTIPARNNMVYHKSISSTMCKQVLLEVVLENRHFFEVTCMSTWKLPVFCQYCSQKLARKRARYYNVKTCMSCAQRLGFYNV